MMNNANYEQLSDAQVEKHNELSAQLDERPTTESLLTETRLVDVANINVVRVVLKSGFPCWIQPNGNRKQRRLLKRFRLNYMGEVSRLENLNTLFIKPQAGHVYYVEEQKLNYFWHTAPVEYESRWIGVTLTPNIKQGKIIGCNIQLHHDQQMRPPL